MADTADDLVCFPPVETHLIRSSQVAQTFRIDVARPPRRMSENERLPVVYVTDGNLFFNVFKEISVALQTFGIHPFPAFILVGIGYPSDLPFSGMLLRCRDLMSCTRVRPDMSSLRSSMPVEGVLVAEEGTKDYGGAEDFLQFIGQELIPFIDQRYETIAGHRTFFGHSGGGFLGLLALFTQSHLFRKYILSSPGLFCSNDSPGRSPCDRDVIEDYGFPMASDFIESAKTLDDIKLYMSIGTEEDFQPAYYGRASSTGSARDFFGRNRLVSSFDRMAALLKAARIPGLELMVESFPGEVHMSVYPTAFIHGVQAVFGLRRIGGLY